jgi:endoglucanase
MCDSVSMKTRPFRARCLALARGLLVEPTAPLFEDLPKAFIRRFVQQRPALRITSDAAGNLLVQYPARGRAAAPLVLVAHMDHPGFRVEAVHGAELQLRFQGYVAHPHARPGARVRLFRRGRRAPIGTARLTHVEYERNRLTLARATVIAGTARGAAFAMWDFPAFVRRGERIVARNCDDGMGCVAALCVLDEVARLRPRGVALQVLFTRAEELGFLGTLEAIRLRTLPRRSVILSLETSKALATAPQGGGVIVRVGDRESTFDPRVTLALQAAARDVASGDPSFRWQRRLMDGGACEATPFCLAGYRASGLAVPLGNYHNQAVTPRGRPTMGPEHILVRDLLDEVRLLVAFALRRERRLSPSPAFSGWMAELAARARTALAPR